VAHAFKVKFYFYLVTLALLSSISRGAGVVLTLYNNSGSSVDYNVARDINSETLGAGIHSGTLVAGETTVVTYTTTGSFLLYVATEAFGTQSGTAGSFSAGGIDTSNLWQVIDGKLISSDATPVSCDIGIMKSGLSNAGLKPVWANTDTSLTADLFREGVDTLVAESRRNGLTPSSGGGGGGAGTNAEAVATEQVAEASAKPSSEDMQSAASSASDAAAGDFDTNSASITVGAGLTMGSPADLNASVFAVTVPGSDHEVSLSPTDITAIAEIMGWVKLLITIYVLYWFEMQLVNFINEQVKFATVSPQAKGNTLAGSGGWVTGAIAASVITIFVATIPALITAHLSGSFDAITTLGGGVTEVGAPSGSDYAQQGWWMLNLVIPVELIITVLVEYLVLRRYAGHLYVLVSTFIRWVIP